MTKSYTVTVKPGSKKGPLVEVNEDDQLTLYVRERALEGKANEAVIKLLAKHFGVAKSQVKIIRGHSSRVKFVCIG